MNTQFTLPRSASMTAMRRLFRRNGDPKTYVGSFLKQGFQCLMVSGLALASYFLISHFLLESVQVVGSSMFPTLRDSDHYFLNRCAYYLHTPKPGDIVVVKDPTDGTLVVKRIIATPGESVYFKKGTVYVNGTKLKEPYLPAGTYTFIHSQGHEEYILCGKDQYFLLGDNRNNSYDSRAYGPVRRQNILGVVVY